MKFYEGVIFNRVSDEPEDATRTWGLKTVKLSNVMTGVDLGLSACKISGPDLYLDADGRPSLPFGTAIVTETNAAAGFIRDETPYAITVEFDSDGTGVRNIYNAETGAWIAGNKDLSIDNRLEIPNTPKYGSFTITKEDIENKAEQGDGSFDGVTLTVKNVSGGPVDVKTGPNATDVRTVADGETALELIFANGRNSVSTGEVLREGKYLVTETKGSDDGSYKINREWSVTYTLTDEAETDETLTATPDKSGEELIVKDAIIRGGVKVGKIDSETGKSVPRAWAEFKGAEFTIYNNSENAVIVEGKEYAPGEAVKTLVADENGIAESTADLLPYGSYYVKETKAPKGYNLNEDWRVDFRIREEAVIVDTTVEETDEEGYAARIEAADETHNGWFAAEGILEGNPAEVPDDIIRVDLEFWKVDINGRRMANIPFLIERLDKDNETIVEAHVVVTDANGYLNTAGLDKSDEKVNSLDQYVEGGRFTDDSKLDSTVGIWFGEQDAEKAGRGALMIGNYRITELQCSANEGMDLLTQKMITAEQTEDITDILTEGKKVSLDAIFVNLIIHSESDVLDDASASETATIGDDISITDTVRYDHLNINSTYRLETELYYIPREGTAADAVSIGKNSKTFKPEKVDEKTETSNGLIRNTVEHIDTSDLEGGTINAVDRLYIVNELGETLLVTHNGEMDITRQTLYVPYMRTDAIDADTNTRVGGLSENAHIRDIVTYENLRNDGMYVLEATLRDASTGEAIIGTDGEPCVTTLTVRVSKRASGVTYMMGNIAIAPMSGAVTMPAFVFDSTGMKGRTLVVTERLFDADLYDGESDAGLVIDHNDLSDEAQTIRFPEITTEAADVNTGTRTAVVGQTVIADKVTMTNLIPGVVYVVTGDLVYKEDCVDSEGAEHKQGKVIATHEPVTVTATAATMTIDLEYEVDASRLEGISGVVFEDAFVNDFPVASHHDYEAEPQTPNWPKVRTTAKDGETEDNVGTVGEEASITDTVSLTNLTIGDTYKVVGTLKYSDGTDFLADGEPLVVESEEFTADKKDMTVELTFEFSSKDLGGKSLVVFEKLFCISSEGEKVTEVARHEDINDEGQTVYIPRIRTKAFDENTLIDHTLARKEVKVIDTVSYDNLLPGKEYTVRGYLVDKTTGEPVIIGGKRVTAEKKFTAEKTSGEVKMEFVFDASSVIGKPVVVFEQLFYNDIEVAAHADIEDADQTDYIPKIGTTALAPDTKDHVTKASEKTVIVDTVEYKGLKPETKYEVRGTLMDQETGKPVLAGGREVTSGATFVTGKADEGKAYVDGTVDITFEFDASETAGITTVAFEELYQQDKLVAVHAEINDAAQTVYIPEIRTTAAADDTAGHITLAREKATITDVVKYTGLLPGKEYTVKGILMAKSTGKALTVDGKEIIAEAAFRADRSAGEVILEFTFDASALAGERVVVFERMYYKDIEIAVHADIDDEDQTVTVTKPQTPAPRTADSLGLVIWIAVVLMAAASIAAILIFLKRKI